MLNDFQFWYEGVAFWPTFSSPIKWFTSSGAVHCFWSSHLPSRYFLPVSLHNSHLPSSFFFLLLFRSSRFQHFFLHDLFFLASSLPHCSSCLPSRFFPHPRAAGAARQGRGNELNHHHVGVSGEHEPLRRLAQSTVI
jgi:hypothetical protein